MQKIPDEAQELMDKMTTHITETFVKACAAEGFDPPLLKDGVRRIATQAAELAFRRFGKEYVRNICLETIDRLMGIE